ncbi:ABC transporter substrate-binding protein [Pelotalea chapellei]|uniref:ABC transporter substrate-binding protein n=1 Tax=Pelotalea chapellei TaxID=44671 RepID=A0ABS5U910_9BACT|nr:ABC transporter substrate binding protein [Pelotalea chapellei]MBT1072148.1 ABC transporter substrate-binding protein [Pelotalea chapellei]
MRRLMLFIFACSILLPSTVQAYEVLVLLSRRDPGYDEVLKGFRAVYAGSQRLVVLSDYTEIDMLRILREEHPRLVLALGDAALKEARKTLQTPVIALMSLCITPPSTSQPNLTGIGIMAPPERYLKIFQSLKLRRVGVVYNSAKNGWYMRQARQAARQAGIELVTREVNNSREVAAALNSLADRVDGLWMPADPTVVTREISEEWFLVAARYSLPLVSFSSAFLSIGAVAAVDLDRVEMGRQAAAMTERILQGGGVADVPPELPRSGQVKGNASLLKRLGMNLGD